MLFYLIATGFLRLLMSYATNTVNLQHPLKACCMQRRMRHIFILFFIAAIDAKCSNSSMQPVLW